MKKPVFITFNLGAYPKKVVYLSSLLITFSFLIFNSTSLPILQFYPPTLSDNIIYKNNLELNLSIDEYNLNSFELTWDERKYAFYDSSLLLALNFNNNSFIGDTSTVAIDISKYANNATLFNGTCWIKDGRYGSAIKFDGVNDYISIPNSDSLTFKKNFTISLWFKLNELNREQYLIARGHDYINLRISRTDKPIFVIYNATGGFIGNCESEFGVANNTWYHLAGVYDDESVKLFLNGVLIKRCKGSAFGQNVGRQNFPLNLGYQSWGGVDFFNGLLDEIRIYNRSFSDQEILISYQTEFKKNNINTYFFYANLTGFSTKERITYFGEAYDLSQNKNSTEIKSVNFPCVNPPVRSFSNLTICNNTFFFNLSLSNSYGVIENVLNDLTVYGNDTKIVGNSFGAGLSNGFIYSTNQVTFKDISIENFNKGVYLRGGKNLVLEGLIINNSNTSGIDILEYCSLVNISNNLIEKSYSQHGISFASNNTLINNNTLRNIPLKVPSWGAAIYSLGSNSIIQNNFIENADIGIYLRDHSKNILVNGNILKNITTNNDWYDVGIMIFDHVNNVTITNNQLLDVGTTGILILKGNDGLTITNNYIDLVDVEKKVGTKTNDINEPPMGIFISELYKLWISDSSEDYLDNISKISTYSSKNIILRNNTFSSNVQVFLRIQGRINITHDLNPSDYWYVKVQFPTYLLDPDEFYISNRYDKVTHYNGGLNDILCQSYMNGSCLILYKLSKSRVMFSNGDSRRVQNVSLFYPYNIFYNITSQVSNDRINISMPVSSAWYYTINMSVAPSSGIATVYVSDFSERYSSWSIQGGSGSIDYVICSLNPSSVYLLKDSGLGVLTLQSSSGGCVSFEYPASSSKRLFDLVPLDGGGSDLAVASFRVPSGVGLGSVVSVSGVVRNAGSAPSGVFYARVFDGSDVKATVRVPSLASGASYTVNASWVPSNGMHVARFSVDYNNSVPEYNESNNDLSASFVSSGPADLSIISSDISLSRAAVVVNDSVNVTARIYNSGGLAAYNVSVKCFDGLPSQNVLLGEAFLDVPAGAHSYAVFQWRAYPKWTHGIYVVVDQAGLIAEAGESNNVAYRNIYVYDLPDLSVVPSDIVSVPSLVFRGSNVVVRAVVRNVGEAPVSSFLVRFLDGGAAFYDKTVSVDWMGSVSVDADWVPQAAGTRNVTVLIDPMSQVTEQSRGNNRADKSFYANATVPSFGNTTTSTTLYSTTTSTLNRTTTTLQDSCVMPGNSLPCNEVTLAEVVSGISAWSAGGMGLNDIIALINSWADQVGYPPV